MEQSKKWLACDRCGCDAKEGKIIGDYCGQLLTADWTGIICGGKIMECEVDRAFIREGRKSFSREMVYLLLLDYADHLLKTAQPDIHTAIADDVITELQASTIKEWFERRFPPHFIGGIS